MEEREDVWGLGDLEVECRGIGDRTTRNSLVLGWESGVSENTYKVDS